MTHAEIQDALLDLGRLTYSLEEEYQNNGGEVTENTEAYDNAINQVKDLLAGEGIDSLGRWLKAKQDEIDTAKAEKAEADRRLKALQNSEEYIRSLITRVLQATDTHEAKGAYYTFKYKMAEKNTVRADALDSEYLNLATEAARDAGLPPFVDVVLKTSATRIKEYAEENEGDGSEFLDTRAEAGITFLKPRKAKEE